MDASRYLDRIGLSPGDESRSALALETLQRRHLATVPFTNLFVYNDAGTTPEPETAVPRIVSGGGGLCYDCNGGFAWLLEELGYDVSLLSARPRHDDGTYGPEYDHLALLVEDHLVDVGFGDFARQPLPLDGGPRSDVSGTYRIVAADRDGGTDSTVDSTIDDECTHLVERQTGDAWEPVYRFDTTPRRPSAFAGMADFHATSPDSHFAGDRLATLPTEDGRLTLAGATLTITEGDRKRKEPVPPGAVETVLADRFGLDERALSPTT